MKIVLYSISIILILKETLCIKLNQSFKENTLNQDERLESNNNKYFAIMQSDGNFVVYSKKGENGRDRDFPIWASQTFKKGQGPYKLIMQNDGNSVLYDKNGKPTWASNTNGRGTPPFRVIMQDDGNLVVYDKNNRPTWASNTNGRK